jgi:polar amino acid transport system substrate-binding protein
MSGSKVGGITKMKKGFFFLPISAIVLCVLFNNTCIAQNCGTDYAIAEGESLTDIARKVYGSPSEWTMIYYANQDRLGPNVSLLVPGTAIRLPCLTRPQDSGKTPTRVSTPDEKFAISPMLKKIAFLTADNFSPFTDRSLPEGGLTTNLISAGMTLIKNQPNSGFDYDISWVNDWSSHLEPLLSSKAFDVGFPWSRPDCEHPDELDVNGRLRCGKFLFSDPLYENVTSVFVMKDSAIAFNQDEEILGKNLCRPKGHFTYLFDKGGRHWLKEKKITLIQPQIVEDCFRLLESGKVDAVVVSDFVGRAAAASVRMTEKIKILQRPMSIDSFHAIVFKTHPNASSILYYINSSLAKLRERGDFDKIVDAQISAFWEAQEKNNTSSQTQVKR